MNSSSTVTVIIVVLLPLILLLSSCDTFLEDNRSVDGVADSSGNETSLETTISTATSTSTVAVASDRLPASNANLDPSGTEIKATDSIDDGQVSRVGVEPVFGEITFALGATEEYEPIGPSIFFTKGITQVHAIFAYSGMSSEYTWARVWYLNDREVSRSSGFWSGSADGVLDYFIDNGGDPLPDGDWVLELYVEDKLRSLGVFIIE